MEDASTVRWDDFLRLPEDDRRELVAGRLVESPVPTKWHEHIVALLIGHLSGWARTHGGRVLGSLYKLRIADDRGVMPDVQLLSAETYRSAGATGLAGGRPELVVEVLSPRNRAHDRVLKLAWYAEVGVPEYWIVDPEARSIERLVLNEGRYSILQTATEGVFRPETFAGLEIQLDELWEAVEDPPR